MLEQYYTVQEVAELLGRSTRSVYRDIYDHTLKAQKAGRGWRIPESSVREFLDRDEEPRFVTLRNSIVDARSQLSADQRMALVQVLVEA